MDFTYSSEKKELGLKPESSPRSKKKIIGFVLLGILILALVLGGVYVLKKRFDRRPDYVRGYRLVEEKVSQSAAIVVHLPWEMDKSIAQKNVEFSPDMKGRWLESKGKKTIIFKPKEKLKLNRYYSVRLAIPSEIQKGGGHTAQAAQETPEERPVIEADFLAVENPEVSAIFPKSGSEASEWSEITIVFNRPMVPLTTLQETEDKDIRVEISPETEGRFKWITTRNLQFIPEERLQRSSHYKVEVKPGMRSMDNLSVAGLEKEFVTRKLRYKYLTEGKLTYKDPIVIKFNQPVDLEKTKKEITLINRDTNQEIPFVIEHYEEDSGLLGEEKAKSLGLFGEFYNLAARAADGFKFSLFEPDSEEKRKEEKNRSIIKIYNKEDRFGRNNLWDFENRYSLEIKKAYPEEGDIYLNEKRKVNIEVAGIVQDLSAESSRTEYAEPNFFDPQGKLWISFYEDINLRRSNIEGRKIENIGYGEKCVQEEVVYSEAECKKEEDKSKIFIDFQEEKINPGESLEINLEKIVNTEGQKINRNSLKKFITVYPRLEVLRTFPQNNSGSAALDTIIICTNSPISAPAKEDYKEYLKSNHPYEVEFWNKPIRVLRESDYYKCRKGEFSTRIGYGLMPTTNYSLEIKLRDPFGQEKGLPLQLTTGEMPSKHVSFYQLQEDYNVTTPEKTKLTFAAKNMEYVNMKICKLGAVNFLRNLENKPRFYDPIGTVSGCVQSISERIELPKRYWIKNYFKVDLKDYFKNPLGHYAVIFYHPNYLSDWKKRQIFERSYLTVTNLGVGEKKIEPEYVTYGSQKPLNDQQKGKLRNLYWVNNLSSLEAVSGATITLYRENQQGALVWAGSSITGDDGIATTGVVPKLKGAVVSKGEDSTVILEKESTLEYADRAFASEKIYLYTDKPIYQAGQEVFIKGIYRLGYSGDYELYQDKKVNLEIYNSKSDKIFNEDLELNDFGTFEARIRLDENAPLGMYRVCAENHSCYYFDVQEYTPAPFEVNLESDKEEYISKDTVEIDVKAKYYFGVPLKEGKVSYTISAQDYHFDRYSDKYFSFGSGWYYRPSSYGEKFLLRGNTSLDKRGEASISQKIDIQSLFENKEDRKSKIVVVEATVKNSQGEAVSSRKSFIVHAGDFYIGIKPEKPFVRKNEKFAVKMKTVDTQGNPTSIRDIKLSVLKTEWIYNKRLGVDGAYHYDWEKKKTLVDQYNFDTNRDGNFSQEIQISEPGSYEIEAEGLDGEGNRVQSNSYLYVSGREAASVRPSEGTELDVEAKKTALAVGEEGEVIIKSPYKEAKALICLERGEVFNCDIKKIEGNLYNYKFRVEEKHIPNIYLSVLLLSSEPGVKFGKVEFDVNTQRKSLDIEVTSDKQNYLPGEKVSLNIKVKDFRGNPVSAELSLAVTDLSVLALKGNPKKNPLVFFYSGFPLTVFTSSNIEDILTEISIPTKGGGGGGAVSAPSLARKRRGTFRETAFWQGVVRTNHRGEAQINFTLPDNLTTWRTEAVGVSKETELGIDYLNFVTRKKVMAVPLKPRFVVPGDTFYIGVKVFNQATSKQKFKVLFNSATLSLKDDKEEKEVSLDPDQTATVYFKVQALPEIDKGQHKFVVSVSGGGFEDTVENRIDITRNNTYEVTSTSNYTSAGLSREYVYLPDNVVKDRGSLSITSSATLAVFLSDALNSLLNFPYGCAEQISSKLNAVAIVQKGLDLPNVGDKFNLEEIKYQENYYSVPEIVDIGLAQLYNGQNSDGGFSYWRKGRSDFYLTLHIVNVFQNLSSAGIDINQESLNRAADYLYTKFVSERNLYEDRNIIILTAHTLFRLPEFKNWQPLREAIVNLAENDSFLQDEIKNSGLAYLAITLVRGDFSPRLTGKVFDVLDNRIDIDARGSFLEKSKNPDWQYYETTIKNTALYLKAQALARRENTITEKVIRWILNSKSKDGSWGSTNNTLTVIDAFTEFLKWKRETESNFSLETFVNQKPKGSFDFKPETILEQLKQKISLKNLNFGEINTIEFVKTDHNQLPNNFYYDLGLKYYLPANQIPPRDEGFSVVENFYRVDDKEKEDPVFRAKVGEVLRGHLQITVPATRKFVMIEDYIPAGMEIINLDLSTEQKSLRLQETELEGSDLRPDFKEIKEDRLLLYRKNLSPGVYEFEYYVRVLNRGKFTHLPARASEMYFPENFGRTEGKYFEVE